MVISSREALDCYDLKGVSSGEGTRSLSTHDRAIVTEVWVLLPVCSSDEAADDRGRMVPQSSEQPVPIRRAWLAVSERRNARRDLCPRVLKAAQGLQRADLAR